MADLKQMGFSFQRTKKLNLIKESKKKLSQVPKKS